VAATFGVVRNSQELVLDLNWTQINVRSTSDIAYCVKNELQLEFELADPVGLQPLLIHRRPLCTMPGSSAEPKVDRRSVAASGPGRLGGEAPRGVGLA